MPSTPSTRATPANSVARNVEKRVVSIDAFRRSVMVSMSYTGTVGSACIIACFRTRASRSGSPDVRSATAANPPAKLALGEREVQLRRIGFGQYSLFDRRDHADDLGGVTARERNPGPDGIGASEVPPHELLVHNGHMHRAAVVSRRQESPAAQCHANGAEITRRHPRGRSQGAMGPVRRSPDDITRDETGSLPRNRRAGAGARDPRLGHQPSDDPLGKRGLQRRRRKPLVGQRNLRREHAS